MTTAAQTDLSCSVMLLARVLLPIPRRDPRRALVLATWMLPSPRNDRLGSRIVRLSGLQASLHVAARVLASRCAAFAALRAFDARLQPSGSLPLLRACYSALQRFPRRDFRPLDHHSVTSVSAGASSAGSFRLHDAPSRNATSTDARPASPPIDSSRTGPKSFPTLSTPR